MKRINFLILTLIFVIITICSCNNTEDMNESSLGSSEVQDLLNFDSNLIKGDNASGLEDEETVDSSNSEVLPDDIICPYEFDTYDELKDAFSKGNSKSIIQSEKSFWGIEFKRFVETITENNLLKLPKVCGELLPLRDNDSLPKIDVFKMELYELPWIWFHGEIDGKTVRVKIAYPTYVEVDEQMDASQILQLIYSEALNVHNYQESEYYENVYLEEIQLKDRTVSAVVFDYADRKGDSFCFYYDGFWISIYTDFKVDDKEFWANFELS